MADDPKFPIDDDEGVGTGTDEGGDEGADEGGDEGATEPGWDPDTGVTTLDPVEIVGDLAKAKAANAAENMQYVSAGLGTVSGILGLAATVTPPAGIPGVATKGTLGLLSGASTYLAGGAAFNALQQQRIADDPPREDTDVITKVTSTPVVSLDTASNAVETSWQNLVQQMQVCGNALHAMMTSFERWLGIKAAIRLMKNSDIKHRFVKLEVGQLDALAHNAHVAVKAQRKVIALAPEINKSWHQIAAKLGKKVLAQGARYAAEQATKQKIDRAVEETANALHLDAHEVDAWKKKIYENSLNRIDEHAHAPHDVINDKCIAALREQIVELQKMESKARRLLKHVPRST